MGGCYSMMRSWLRSGRNRREESNRMPRKKNDDQLQRIEQGTSSNPGQFEKHKASVSKNKRASPQKSSAKQHEKRSSERKPTTTAFRNVRSPNRRRPVHDDEERLLESECGGWSSEPSISITNDARRRRNYKVVDGSSEIIQRKFPKDGRTAGRNSRSADPSQRLTLSEPSLTDVTPNNSQMTRLNARLPIQIRSEKHLTEKCSKDGTNAIQTRPDREKILRYFEDPMKWQGNGRALEKEVNIQREIKSKVSFIKTNDTKTSIPSGVDAMLHISREPVKTYQTKSADARVLGDKMVASAAPSFHKATEPVTVRQATATCTYPLRGKMTATAASPDRSTKFATSEPEKITEEPQSKKSYQGMFELNAEALRNSDKCLASSEYRDQVFENHNDANLDNKRAYKLEDKIQQQQINSANYNWPKMTIEMSIDNKNEARENKKRRSDYDEADNQAKKFHQDSPEIQLNPNTADENIYQDNFVQIEYKHVANQGPMEAVSQHHENQLPTASKTVSNDANEKIQKLEEKELTILKKIHKLFQESRKFEKLVEEFVGAVGTQEHYYIDESLARLLLDLDDLGVLKNETLKLERRKVIKYIYHLLDVLEERATSV